MFYSRAIFKKIIKIWFLYKGDIKWNNENYGFIINNKSFWKNVFSVIFYKIVNNKNDIILKFSFTYVKNKEEVKIYDFLEEKSYINFEEINIIKKCFKKLKYLINEILEKGVKQN